MKKHFALLTLLAVAAAITVGCGDSHNPTFTKLPFISFDRSSSTELFVMNLDGSSVTPVAITADGAQDSYSPSVSADFKTIAFLSEGNLWTSNADGSSQIQLTVPNSNGVWSARISPDGKKIVYGIYNGSTYDVRSINVDGTGDTDLTTTLPSGMAGGCYTANYSADSKKIAFACWGGNENDNVYGLYLMNADGSSQSTVIAQTDFLVTPMFSPDGKKILFVSFGLTPAARRPNPATAHKGQRHGTPGSFTNMGIVSVNLDGSSSTVVVPNVFEAEILNSTLYYTVEDSNLELEQIYKANIDGTSAVSISDGTNDDWLGFYGD